MQQRWGDENRHKESDLPGFESATLVRKSMTLPIELAGHVLNLSGNHLLGNQCNINKFKPKVVKCLYIIVY